MLVTGPFDVSIVLHLADLSARQSVHRNLPRLEQEEPLMDAAGSIHEKNELIRFSCQIADSTESLLRMVVPRGGSRMLVVSDLLTAPGHDGGYAITPLTTDLRSAFMARSRDVLGLVALVPGRPHKTPDIDVTASLYDAQSLALKRPILRAANAIWLKSPFHHPPTEEETFAIWVRVVRSLDELTRCAALRFRVYDALGYLDERLSAGRGRLELDCYDYHSLHLCAVDNRSGDVAGTLRIVLPAHRCKGPRETAACDDLNLRALAGIADALPFQRAWVDRIVKSKRTLREKVGQADPLIPFPIMDNSDFGDCWPDFLATYDFRQTAEISRVVVAPRYRGMGISKVLMRAAIAASVDLGLRHLVLECIPLHVEMYQKHGFDPLPKHHCRSRDLDQIAVGMKLCLEDSATSNTATAMVQRDLAVLRRGMAPGEILLSQGGLCMCRLTDCWSRGKYPHLGRRNICPLASASRS